MKSILLNATLLGKKGLALSFEENTIESDIAEVSMYVPEELASVQVTKSKKFGKMLVYTETDYELPEKEEVLEMIQTGDIINLMISDVLNYIDLERSMVVVGIKPEEMMEFNKTSKITSAVSIDMHNENPDLTVETQVLQIEGQEVIYLCISQIQSIECQQQILEYKLSRNDFFALEEAYIKFVVGEEEEEEVTTEDDEEIKDESVEEETEEEEVEEEQGESLKQGGYEEVEEEVEDEDDSDDEEEDEEEDDEEEEDEEEDEDDEEEDEEEEEETPVVANKYPAKKQHKNNNGNHQKKNYHDNKNSYSKNNKNRK